MSSSCSGVDKLSLVFAIPKKHYEATVNFFRELSFRESRHFLYRYHFSINLKGFLEFECGENFQVFCSPYNTECHFLKIEFNPNKFSMADMMKIIGFYTDKVFPEFDFRKGIINRIDFNVDIYDEDLTVELLYHFLKSNSRSSQIVVKNNEVETFYLGSMNSDSFIRVYDKYKESGDEAYKGCVRIEKQINNTNQTLLEFIGNFPELYDFGLKFFEPVSKNCEKMCDYFSIVQYGLKYIARNLSRKYSNIFISREVVMSKLLAGG